jgi:hypothetical protein
MYLKNAGFGLYSSAIFYAMFSAPQCGKVTDLANTRIAIGSDGNSFSATHTSTWTQFLE